jgi:hypothetical protein
MTGFEAEVAAQEKQRRLLEEVETRQLLSELKHPLPAPWWRGRMKSIVVRRLARHLPHEGRPTTTELVSRGRGA